MYALNLNFDNQLFYLKHIITSVMIYVSHLLICKEKVLEIKINISGDFVLLLEIIFW